MRNIFCFLFLLCSFFLSGQASSVAEKYASTIESETIKSHVYKLASPELQGRETGTPGNLLAAQYIADQFKTYQIPVIPNDNNYYQEVDFTTIKWSEIFMTVNGQKAEHLKDFLSVPQYFPLSDDTIDINALTFFRVWY